MLGTTTVSIIVVAFACLLLLFLYFNTSLVRLIKTGYLIVTTAPYERVVEGAPSILILGEHRLWDGR